MDALYFDLRPTRAYVGLLLHRLLVSPISYGVYIAALLPLLFDAQKIHNYTTFSLITGLLLFGLHIEALFIQHKLEDDEEGVLDVNNLGCYLTFDLMYRIRGRGNVTLLKLFAAAVATKRSSFVLHMFGIQRKDILKQCKGKIPNGDVEAFLKSALGVAKKFNQKRISGPIILLTFLQQGGVFTKVLHAADLSLQDAEDVVRWEKFQLSIQHEEWVLHPNRLIRTLGSMGRGWVQGYTSDLDKISEEITGRILWQTKQRGIMIHKQKLESSVHILSRSGQKNMMLVGEDGTGKRTMIENIGTLLREEEMKQGHELTRILLLNTEQLMSGYAYPDRVLLKALSKAEKSGKFILIIENLSVFLDSANPNIRTVLSKFLQSTTISVFAITTPDEYHKQIKSTAFNAQFEKIHVEDAEDDETLSAVMVRYFRLVKQHRGKVHITYRALKMLMQLSARYIGEGGMPGKALDVLEDAILSARNDRKEYVTEDHIRKAISLKAHMNVEEISDDERQKLLQLEDALRVNLVGQEDAVSALVNALKRGRLDINAGKRPLGTFLFLGPTGVGKTYTAKILAEQYFGSVDALIRVDMNEYGTEESVRGLIDGFLAKRVQDKPFSLILLDEIEKAHPKVLNLFLQILDEGHLADTSGGTTDFRNTIIIATSNAGALFIRDFVQEHKGEENADFKKSLVDTILKERIFSPEFINRFDEVILYYPMNIREALIIALLMLDGIVKEIADAKGFNIQVSENVVAEVVKHGFSVEFGAREMRRVIVDVIENYLADYLLQNPVQRGDSITITLADIQKYLPKKS